MKISFFLTKEKDQCIKEEGHVVAPKLKIMVSAHAWYLLEDGVMILLGNQSYISVNILEDKMLLLVKTGKLSTIKNAAFHSTVKCFHLHYCSTTEIPVVSMLYCCLDLLMITAIKQC